MHRWFFISLKTPDREFVDCVPKYEIHVLS